MNVIELSEVSKKYKVFDHPGDRLIELASLHRLRFHRECWALRDISVNIKRGETFCIVGENGSGKSTLLQIIAGIVQPTSGHVEVRGRVAALLELGSGFHPEFTGRENVYLNSSILGLSREQVDARLPQILDFAEIGPAIDQPIKTYSSGMVVRLAFSLAVHVDADVLIVDEALAVGDIYFRQRCMRKIHELRSENVTIVFVSHEIGDVKALGHRTLWLRDGAVAQLGDTRDVTLQYMAHLVKKDSSYLEREKEPGPKPSADRQPPQEIITTLPDHPERHGDGRAQILGVSVVDERGHAVDKIQGAESVVVRISVRASDELRLPMVGIQLRNEQGVDFAGTNTSREGLQLPSMTAGEVLTVDFHLRLPELPTCRFSFSPAIADGTLTEFHLCDMIHDAVKVSIDDGGSPVRGHMRIPCRSVTFARQTEKLTEFAQNRGDGDSG